MGGNKRYKRKAINRDGLDFPAQNGKEPGMEGPPAGIAEKRAWSQSGIDDGAGEN